MPTKIFFSRTEERAPRYGIEITAFSQLPSYCIQIQNILNKQPPFDGQYEYYGSGQTFARGKAIRTGGFVDAKIFTLMATQLKTDPVLAPARTAPIVLSKEEDWHYERDPIYDIHGPIIDGIFTPSRIEHSPLDLQHLKENYTKIIMRMRTGWEESSLAQNRTLLLKKDPDQFSLFIKRQNSLPQDGKLINLIATKLGLSEDIVCSNFWSQEIVQDGGPLPTELGDQIPYIWVKNSNKETVRERFGFEFLKKED